MSQPVRLTPKQAAERMCISLSLVYQLLQQRKLPAYRIGVRGRGKWVIEESDMNAFLESCKVNELPDDDGREFEYMK